MAIYTCVHNFDADSYDNAHDCCIKKEWPSVLRSSNRASVGSCGILIVVASSVYLADNVGPKHY